MRSENDKLIDKFLKEIKKHLPEWLKSDDEKVEDILLEVSSHIWDSAQEIGGSDDPDDLDTASIQEAINRLGNPKEIAKNYKKRGTPKYFISMELWPIYSKVNSYLFAITFLVVTLVQAVLVEPDNLLQALINGITISYPVIITFIVIVTLIFVGLSYEGYFPTDLISQDTTQDETKDPMSTIYKPNEFLFNGIVGLLFGLFIIILPVDIINLFRIIINLVIGLFGSNPMAMYVNMSVEVQILLTVIGIVTIITGIINLLKIGTNDARYQLKMNFGLIVTGIFDFGLGIYILTNLHLFSEILPLSENILLFLCFLGIIGAIIEVIRTISQNITLYGLLEEENGFST